jgi:hypothetical protein
VAQLVEALRYELTDRGFDSVWVVCIFYRLNPTDHSMAQGYLLEGKFGRCIKPTTLPSSCADCPEIVGASTSLRSYPCLYKDYFTFSCKSESNVKVFLNNIIQLVK